MLDGVSDVEREPKILVAGSADGHALKLIENVDGAFSIAMDGDPTRCLEMKMTPRRP